MNTLLTANERQDGLAQLFNADWEMVAGRDAIQKAYKFKNFAVAFDWMSKVAHEAEELDHHPEWSNVYNRVSVTLTTHSADGLTQLDVTLAQKMDELARSF